MKRTAFALSVFFISAMLTGCADSAENITPTEKGLQYISVDGTVADLSDGIEAVEAALGEHFAVLDHSRLPDDTQTIQLTADIYDMEWAEYHFISYGNEYTNNEPVVLYKDMPSDMTFEEFCNAYDGLYYKADDIVREYTDENGTVKQTLDTYEIVQENSRVLTTDELLKRMEDYKYSYTTDIDGFVHGYILERAFADGTGDMVILKCGFDQQKCASYSIEIYEKNNNVVINDP